MKVKAKESLLLEARKLISILDSWGNVLVPPIEGGKETYAITRLEWVTKKLHDEYNLSLEQIDAEINNL